MVFGLFGCNAPGTPPSRATNPGWSMIDGRTSSAIDPTAQFTGLFDMASESKSLEIFCGVRRGVEPSQKATTS